MANLPLGKRGFLVFLFFAELFFLAQLESALRIAVLGGASLIYFFSWHNVSAAYRLIGPLLVISPVFGSFVLPALLVGWLSGRICARGRELQIPFRVKVALDLIALVFVLGFLSTVLWDFDWLLFKALFDYGSFSAVMQHLRATYVTWYSSLTFLIVLGLAGLLLVEAVAGFREEHFPHFVQGVVVGCALASFYGAAQILNISHFFQINRGAFWHHVERYNATFSDPNALGVIVPFLVAISLSWFWTTEKQSVLLRVCALIFSFTLLIVSLWSGSRTFWLGLAVLSFGAISMVCQRTPGLRRPILFFGLLLLGLASALSLPSVNERVQQVVPLPAVQRMVKTLNFEQAQEMLYSRSLAARVVGQVVSERPFFGIGNARYRLVQHSIAEKIGEGQGNWWDNANNFYLQILAEHGAVGLSLLVIAFWLLVSATRSANECELDRWVQWMLATVFLVLITGPHIEFLEVFFLWIFLLAAGLKNFDSSSNINNTWSYVLLALLVVLSSAALSTVHIGHRGVYQVELAENEKFIWTSKRASLIWCREQRGVNLILRALTPGLDENPAMVVVRIEGSEPDNFELNSTQWKSVALGTLLPGQKVSIETSRVWRPVDQGAGSDSRLLGLQLRWPTGACERWAW